MTLPSEAPAHPPPLNKKNVPYLITWWQYLLIPATHERFPESVLSARPMETSKEWGTSFFFIDLKHLQVTVADPRG